MRQLKVSGAFVILVAVIFTEGCAQRQTSVSEWWQCAAAGALVGGAGGAAKNRHTAVWSALGGAVLGGVVCALSPKHPEPDIDNPSDTDSDSIPGLLDKCPDTPPGALVGPDGCPVVHKVRLEAVHFAFDSARLTPEAEAVLMEEAVFLKKYPTASIRFTGYTDSTGPDGYNVNLSERRAFAAKAFLINQGVDPLKVIVHGEGKKYPVGNNRTHEGRKENRRVEVEVEKGDETP